MTLPAYHIIRRPRRKTLCLRIDPDNRIEVLAPARISEGEIAAFVASKHDWLQRQMHFNRHIRSPRRPRTFTEGEMFPLLGREYRLAFSRQRQTRQIRIQDDCLVVASTDPARHAEAMVRDWYKDQAGILMQRLCAHYTAQIGLKPASVGIKAYRSRWGSCHNDGRIYFNWRLVMAPESVCAYVAVHELCHLRHANHSKAFWQMVERILPDFKEAQAWLKIHGHSLDV